MAGRTVVVGAGLAGLSAAIHLAGAGREVVVVEAGPQPGGRCGTATVGGYRFDTGPTVLTMPEVLRATVGAAGEELDDWLPLRRLDPTYRLSFHDGSRLDVLPDAGRMAAEVERLAGPEEARRYLAFRDHLGRMHRAEWAQFVDRNLDRLGELARPLALWRVARLGGFRRLEALVATHLSDWRLRRAHTFQALYLGLSPFDALGLYAVVAYMDTVGGAFVPRRGGMHGAARLGRAAARRRRGGRRRPAQRLRGAAAAGHHRLAGAAAPAPLRALLPAAAPGAAAAAARAGAPHPPPGPGLEGRLRGDHPPRRRAARPEPAGHLPDPGGSRRRPAGPLHPVRAGADRQHPRRPRLGGAAAAAAAAAARPAGGAP